MSLLKMLSSIQNLKWMASYQDREGNREEKAMY